MVNEAQGGIDRRVLSSPDELRALLHPLRGAVLDLLLERPASVTELARALDRPKSTVAHHVAVLESAGLVEVTGTRRVRAVEERSYGRTARLFVVGAIDVPEEGPPWQHPLAGPLRDSAEAHRADTLRSNTRTARIPRQLAADFWTRVEALMGEFADLPRSGDETFGLTVALYPGRFPALPEEDDDAPVGGG